MLLAVALAVSLPAWSAPPADQPMPGVASGAPAKLPLSQTGVKNLDLYADGDSLHLLYAEQAADGAQSLWHRRSGDAGRNWSAPVRVDTPGQRVFPAHNGGEAQVAARGPRVVAAWTGYGSGWGGAGPIAVAVSEDGGGTWRPGPNPADDASTQGHGFLDLAATREGFHLVWLDNRAGPQGLRHARSTDPGHAWSPNATVEPKTCACCWNALLPGTGRSLYLLYRADSPRDMALAASPDEGATWTRHGAVGSFGWEAKSCPHTGGGLALTGSGNAQTLHVSVWTGREGAAGLYYLASTDGGATWSKPRHLG
ncbi:MAG TPA: sialidase family protein, partial [Burkholderiales bacterium]|nr:sialidase family protein [Burkholderiales bacterium]